MQYWVVRFFWVGLGVRRVGPHRVYGSYDYAVVGGVLEVYAIEPIDGHCTQHSHDEV